MAMGMGTAVGMGKAQLLWVVGIGKEATILLLIQLNCQKFPLHPVDLM